MLNGERLKAAVSIGLVLALAGSGTGCADPAKYRSAVAKFRDASASVIASAKAIYAGLNSAERKHYVDAQLAGRKPMDPAELEKVEVLDAHEMAVRTSALAVLDKFSDLLVQLATTQSADAVRTKTNDLAGSVKTLASDVAALSGGNSTAFQARTGPVFPVLSTALQAIVNAKTEAALRKAVIDGVKPVNELIAALEIDMRLAHARERNFLSQRRSEAYVHYRADLDAKAKSETLRKDADAILQVENEWESFEGVNPTAGLEAMRQAYDALAAFLKKPKPSDGDFQALLDSVDSFVNSAGQAAQAAKALAAE